MSNKGQMLQDPFLNTLRKEHVQVSIYLVNGIKLQGQIESFDQYVVLLKNTVTQMVYKHAISTVVPARPVAMPHHAPNHDADNLIATAGGATARCGRVAGALSTHAPMPLMFERPSRRQSRAARRARLRRRRPRVPPSRRSPSSPRPPAPSSSARSPAGARVPIPRSSPARARSTRSTRCGARPTPTS